MAKIYNSETLKEVQIGGSLQVSVDKVPTEMADKIVPVMEVNPKLLRRVNWIQSNTSSASGTLTVTTTSAVQDTYLTFLQFSMIKNATCDIANGYMNIVIYQNGGAVNLIRTAILTLTAQEQNIFISFPTPIKLDRASAITLGGTFTAGNLNRAVVVGGYTIDNSNA